VQTPEKKTSRLVTPLLTFLLVVGAAALMHFYDNARALELSGTPPIVSEGAWGKLFEWNVRIEQPVEYIGFDQTQGGDPLWNFGMLSEPAVRALLQACGCSEPQIGQLLKCRQSSIQNTFVLKPDEETFLSLTQAVRSKLYLELSKNQLNRFQFNPYFIPDDDVDKVLATYHYENKEVVISLLKKLTYERNGFNYFSDPEVVLKHLASPKERLEFLKSMSGVSSVMCRVPISKDSDLDKISNYWTLMTGLKSKDVKPLLEAEKMLPEGGSLSLIYLLPPLAREKLFTTPLPSDGKSSLQPDCHWSTLNFFASSPDPRMLDNAFASRFIIDNYYQVAEPTLPGDLVLLLNSENKVVHSSVHLADDIVFTKNGFNYAQPWVLMREKVMAGYFSALEPVKVVYFRRKTL